jgi:hypothetical protein
MTIGRKVIQGLLGSRERKRTAVDGMTIRAALTAMSFILAFRELYLPTNALPIDLIGDVSS